MFLQSLPEFRAKVSVVHVHQYKSILFYFFCFSFLTQAQCVCLQCRRPGFNSWVGKVPWRRKWQSTPALLPGKSHGWRSLIGYSPWGRKESDMTERFHYSLLPRHSWSVHHTSVQRYDEQLHHFLSVLVPSFFLIIFLRQKS